ncbi:MAG: M23 family metallopeptidase [Gemmatimonadetes bacterium]|nr:M23 family metallopeptidase [Gemmatimonadota bacterium]
MLPSFLPSTPHESYEYAIRQANLQETALGYEWLIAARRVLTHALTVETPYEEVGYFDPLQAGAMGYRVSALRGQMLVFSVEIDGDGPSRVFLDLFRAVDDTLRPHRREAYADSTDRVLQHFVRRDGDYILRVQPELLRGGRYRITITQGASLAFPVEGEGLGSIRSVFGDVRDGGRRDHHGVDIFAPRGTPVLAASSGQVRSTRTGGLGGRVVWLKDEFGQSQYYAHLDSQAVRRGQRVNQGDTLGFVGNTGNARTTSPHLHFGIYSRGPYDPYPSLKQLPATPPRLTADTSIVGRWARSTSDGLRMRASPTRRAQGLGEIARHTPMLVIGGVGGWYRVILPDGAAGFVLAVSLEPIAPLRRAELTDGGVLLDSPIPTAVVVETMGPGSEVAVLGEYGEYLFVQPDDGPPGWLLLD